MPNLQHLLLKLDEIHPYPALMTKVRAEIRGLAFFPGGRGLYRDDDETISGKEVMILGQDFDTKAKYEDAVERGYEDPEKNKTWVNLLRLLRDAGIPPADCFFTNALMGVRCTASAVGVSSGFRDEHFLQQCRQFFLYQLQVQKPVLVSALGLQVARFLAPLSADLEDWKHISSFTALNDDEQKAIRKNVRFEGCDFETTVVLLMHPSARAYNLSNRQYLGKAGHEAQVQLLMDGLDLRH